MKVQSKRFKPRVKYRLSAMLVWVGVFAALGVTTLLLTKAETPGGGKSLPCDGGNGVYVYQEKNYQGLCDRFIGDSALPFSWNVNNDAASSIKIVGPLQTALYVDGNCNGAITHLRSSDSDLSDNEIGDNQLSSLRVAGSAATIATGYCVDSDGSYNVSGGLFSVSWQDLSDGYKDLAVDITPENSDSDFYFFATQAFFKDCSGPPDDCGFYTGIQTYGARQQAKNAIFSIWGATSGTPGPGATGNLFDGEGTGYSVSLPYNWQLGHTYRTHVYTSQTTSPIGQWSASVKDVTTGIETLIGTINVAANGRHDSIINPVNFHERYYGGPDTPCATVPTSKVSFTNATASNGTVKSKGWLSDNYNGVMSMTECQNRIWHVDTPSGATSNVGVDRPSDVPFVARTTGPPKVPASLKKCDFNNDTKVDSNDLFILLANINKIVTANAKGDCNGNAKTDTNDLFILLAAYGS